MTAASTLRLSSRDRAFFTLVSQAGHANPFGVERFELDRSMAGAPRDVPRESWSEVIPRMLERLRRRLAALESRGRARLELYAAEDSRLLEHAVMFDAFHGFLAALDSLITEQLEEGGSPRKVPFARDLLAQLVRRGFTETRARRVLERFFQMRRAFFFIQRGLVGRSPSMGRLREALWNNIFTHDIERYDELLWDRMEDFSTILLGETGSGKGAAAAAIGRSGHVPYDERRGCFEVSFTELLVPLNLSQFPESLIESELFGHKKGAFTGAIDSHPGAFARCSAHGAVFLDEIGELSIPVQIKLLRVLQERIYAPVGSHEERRFEGRVIAATHRSLAELRRAGRFRDDFYYRLCADLIAVPPLRVRLAEQPGELDDLLAHIVARAIGRESPALVAEVHAALARDLGPGYAWPGNVRELEQCVRRVLLTGRCQSDARVHDDMDEREGGLASVVAALRAGRATAGELLAGYCAHLYRRLDTYEAVARVTGLDRRTVRKHVKNAEAIEVGARGGRARGR